MRLAIAALTILALTACGRKSAPAAAGPDAPPAGVLEVAAADGLGEPGDAVKDVAFWSHPSIAFEGLLFAATESAVKAFVIETGLPAFEIPLRADRLEIIYAGVGVQASGHLIASSNGGYQISRIDQDGKAFARIALAAASSAAAVYCARGGATPAIFEMTAGGEILKRTLTFIANGADLGEPQKIADVPEAIGCHVDPLSDEINIVGRDGAIRRVDPTTGAVFGVAMPKDLAPSSSAFAVGRNESGERQGLIALLDASAGTVSLFDAVDGHALGRVRIKATFDLDAVQSAAVIAVGSANYGGVYRDGALAVVTAGAGAPIRLVPWNGVMGALSLPVPEVVDPRAPLGKPAEEGIISIDVIEP